MVRVKAVFKTWFGSLEFEFSNPEELKRGLSLIRAMVEGAKGLKEILGAKMIFEVQPQEKLKPFRNLEGIVEWTIDGPVIVSPEKAKLSQYEAIGLILYASKGQTLDPKTISLLLRNSGIRVSNPSARLKEMAKSGRVFKPNSKEALWKLSAQGQLWVKKTVISKLREGTL